MSRSDFTEIIRSNCNDTNTSIIKSNIICHFFILFLMNIKTRLLLIVVMFGVCLW